MRIFWFRHIRRAPVWFDGQSITKQASACVEVRGFLCKKLPLKKVREDGVEFSRDDMSSIILFDLTEIKSQNCDSSDIVHGFLTFIK